MITITTSIDVQLINDVDVTKNNTRLILRRDPHHWYIILDINGFQVTVLMSDLKKAVDALAATYG